MAKVKIAQNYIGLNQRLVVNCTDSDLEFTDAQSYSLRLVNMETNEDVDEYTATRSGQTITGTIPGGVLSSAVKYRAIGQVIFSYDTDNPVPCTPIEFTVSQY